LHEFIIHYPLSEELCNKAIPVSRTDHLLFLLITTLSGRIRKQVANYRIKKRRCRISSFL
ncbi:hypothetical protein, partial [Wolbachia pipientis]|uniref:hypothetical protein n=1 Tax=Wolbachia pipientis TaxID=955 RepID=UPI001C5F2940